MKLFTPLLSYATASISIGTQPESNVNLDRYFSPASQIQINMMRDAILGNQLPNDYLTKLDELCDPCRPPATLNEIIRLLPLPGLTSGDGNGEEKVQIFVGITCEAVNCRDRVVDCPSRAAEGVCETSVGWAQQYCAQTCGCIPKTCADDLIPGVGQAQVSAYLESEQDAEHSSEMIDLPMHEAIKYLDPSNILSQFDKNIRKTLKDEMCFVPDANARIIAANELLKVLAADQDAKVLNALSPKLPMYLEAIPLSMKNVLANDVICGGYKRSTSASSCLDQRITAETRYCRARLPRYTYNKNTGFCEQIDYDGCYKTENRFLTQESCQDTCKNYKSALMEVHKQKLQRFMSSLTPDNLRQSMLLMFGKTTSDDTTGDLIRKACDVEGVLREEFRDLLCDRLYSVFNTSDRQAKVVTQKTVVIEEDVCPTNLAERETCVDKPRRGFKATCEESGCCWDPQPQIKYAKWKHYCFKKVTVQSKPVPKLPAVKQVESDSEHSSCNVGMSSRTFCAARNHQAKNVNDVRASCESAGCCFEEKPTGGVYYKWRLSCFNPN